MAEAREDGEFGALRCQLDFGILLALYTSPESLN
jgi:hypothetical protein